MCLIEFLQYYYGEEQNFYLFDNGAFMGMYYTC